MGTVGSCVQSTDIGCPRSHEFQCLRSHEISHRFVTQVLSNTCAKQKGTCIVLDSARKRSYIVHELVSFSVHEVARSH